MAVRDYPGRAPADDVVPEDAVPRVLNESTLWREAGQEEKAAALRATATGTVARVFRGRASGLWEDRPGLEKTLAAVADGQVTVVRVTHEDRLARFGAGWLRRLLAESDRRPPGGGR